MKITKRFLRKHGACHEGYEWAVGVIGGGMELTKMLPRFERADWMLWLLVKVGLYTRQQLVRLACTCATMSLKHVKRGEKRPALAIWTTLRWTIGKATIEEVRAASRAAHAAAAHADSATADDAAFAAFAAFAADAAADAARAAHATANDAAYAAWVGEHRKLCRAILREMRTREFRALGKT